MTRRRVKTKTSSALRRSAVIEILEDRRLMSAGTSVSALSAQNVDTAVAFGVRGYTPSQIRKAYGFDQVAGDGSGQTIAIIDAYNDPNLAADLRVFNAQFGLPSCSLAVVNQTGGLSLPVTDSGWASETALDVEWAHAIAPGAGILVVEAYSDSTDDMMAAVEYARQVAGVSVVSMSWGGSDAFGRRAIADQLAYDKDFSTPTGHKGITFVAAAGDDGGGTGTLSPADAPGVLSVGGTNLRLSDTSGTYGSESSWSASGSGYSSIEPEPSYQLKVQNTGKRSVADVSYNADPAMGFAVYDSLSDHGKVGWQVIGGTSAGTPQWAALIAIADEGRAAAGLDTLDGASQTLPLLYNTYSDPGTAGYADYTKTFHDVSTGGASGARAAAGYEIATGLGTPIVQAVVAALGGASSIGSAGSDGSPGPAGTTDTTGSSGPTDAPAPVVAAPAPPPARILAIGNPSLSGTFVTPLPTSAVQGHAGTLKIRLTNSGTAAFRGPVSITLYASTDSSLSTDDKSLTAISISKLKLSSGGSKAVTVRFVYPTDISEGSYILSALIEETATGVTSVVIAPTAIAFAPPKVDLSTTFAAGAPILVSLDGRDSVLVTIKNLGNVTASGSLSVSLNASTDTTRSASDPLLANIAGHKIHIAPGKSVTLRLRFLSPTDFGSTYNLLATTASTLGLNDTNTSNDMAVVLASYEPRRLD